MIFIKLINILALLCFVRNIRGFRIPPSSARIFISRFSSKHSLLLTPSISEFFRSSSESLNKRIKKRKLSFRGETSQGAALSESVQTSDSMQLTKLFSRASWVSWWIQVILSVVSAITLVFANTVRQGAEKTLYFWSSGFAFSAASILLALANTLWTFNITKLCSRVAFKKVEEKNVAPNFRKYSQISVALSLFGMFCGLVGAEQIVGVLASKILSNQGPGQFTLSPGLAGSASSAPFQALDIFLVQANTNCLVAHFASLVIYVVLQTQLPQSMTLAGGVDPTESLRGGEEEAT